MTSMLHIMFSKFAFGGLTKNQLSTRKKDIIKRLKFLLRRSPADANLLLVPMLFVVNVVSVSNDYFFCPDYLVVLCQVNEVQSDWKIVP